MTKIITIKKYGVICDQVLAALLDCGWERGHVRLKLSTAKFHGGKRFDLSLGKNCGGYHAGKFYWLSDCVPMGDAFWNPTFKDMTKLLKSIKCRKVVYASASLIKLK